MIKTLSLIVIFFVESMDAPRTHRGQIKDLYYLGVRRNLRTVFGSNLLLALLPVDTR